MKNRTIVVVFLSLLLINVFGTSSFALTYQTGDDYKYKNYTYNAGPDEWNFYYRQCTSFVAWCLNTRNGIKFTNQYAGADRWGNGGEWGAKARALGFTVDMNPAIGSVAWRESGTWGHVAWVYSVEGDNVTVEEYNAHSDKRGYWRRNTTPISNWSGFIHIADIGEQKVIPPNCNTNHGPYGYLEATSGKNGKLYIGGWASDYDMPNEPMHIHTYVGGPAGSNAPCYLTIAGNSRADVGNHGFDATFSVDVTGSQTIYVYVVNPSNGKFALIDSRTVTISPDSSTAPAVNHDPYGNFEYASGGRGNLNIAGWVNDDDASDKPVEIHVYVGGPAGSDAPCYVYKADLSRPDVGNHGFNVIIPVNVTGEKTVYVYAINQPKGANLLLGTKTVTIVPADAVPYGGFDVATGGKGSIYVAGWAKDDDVPNGALDIHVYVGGPAGSGAKNTIVVAGNNREDVGKHAFNANIPVNLTGQQEIYVYAINQPSGANTLLGKKTVTISPKEYTVTYVANAGTDSVSNIPSNQTKVHGKALKLSGNIPERKGYTFIGWSTSVNGPVAYKADNEYNNNSNVTLYAVWTVLPTATPIVTPTATPVTTPTPTPTPKPTETPTPKPTVTPTPKPTETPKPTTSPTLNPTATPTVTPTPTATPTALPTPKATVTPTPKPTATPTPKPTATPTPKPTATPTPKSTATPTPKPTATPTPKPTATPTPKPTATPTPPPIVTPTPTATLTPKPTVTPTPTATPTPKPTAVPIPTVSQTLTPKPTTEPVSIVNVFTLPANLSEIESEAFTGVNADQIIVPQKVCFIWDRAFANCPNLKEVRIRSNDRYLNISKDAFEGCGSLKKIIFYNEREYYEYANESFGGYDNDYFTGCNATVIYDSMK